MYWYCVVVFPQTGISTFWLWFRGYLTCLSDGEKYSKMVALKRTNYHLWKGKIKYLLFVKKMHLLIFATHKSDSMFEEY